MRMILPFFNTKPETDILWVFLLTPVWWLTGFNLFVYHLISLWAFLKTLTYSMRSHEPLRISVPLVYFFVFLVSYLISILINVGIRPSQRIFASFNNYSMIITGFLLMMSIFNSDGPSFLRNFIKWGSRLCILTTCLGSVILLLWFLGFKDLRMDTLMYKFFPSLMQYPYFIMLLVVTGTTMDYLRFEMPRLTLYSAVATSTGGLMLFLIPLMAARFCLKKRVGWVFWILLFFSLVVLCFTVSRAAVVALACAFVVVTLFSKGVKTTLIIFFSLAVMILSGGAYRFFEWILNLRQASTIGRLNLYEEALRIVMDENPLFGMGVRLREDFTMMAIGSHSLYIEIIFVAGLMGIFLFLLFQFLVLKQWFDQKKLLRNETERIVWKFLGMALIGMNLWLVTDTLFGPPFTAYGYFLIVSGILILSKLLTKGEALSPPFL